MRGNSAPQKEDIQRSVSFAEHDEVFIIPEDGEDGDQLGFSSVIERELQSCDRTESTQLAAKDHCEDEDSRHKRTFDIRENMRDCVYNWSLSPYWELLEGCVNDKDGEAKDVQKYITTYACLEIDGDTPRGLERQVCQGHHDARKRLTENTTQAVLSQYFRLRYEEKHSDSEVWKRLRFVYKEHSKGARALAKKFGKADEVAAKRKEANLEKALALIQELKEKLKQGSLRVKKASSCSSTRESNNSTRGVRSRSIDSLLPLRSESDHVSSSSSRHMRSIKQKKENKTVAMRFPSFSSKSRKEGRHLNDHAADLYHEIDKKGKTKRSSRWRSLKERITKTVQSSSREASPTETTLRTQ